MSSVVSTAETEPMIMSAGAMPDADGVAIEASLKLLTALFDESDTILFRPIETWDEQGKKRSRVDYKNTCHRRAKRAILQVAAEKLLQLASKNRLNLFFGVCPRVGPKGRFDQAWQIRIVRVLWTDIDHITVEDALERVAKSGLPEPSIVVNSGNGVHLYWLLDEPYLIDAVDPLPVETEWIESRDGRKKPRKYIVENGEKVYLDHRRHVSRLSPRAQHIQDVLAGIANAVGGDHTTDLARLLRLPGPFNRKNERNGQEPVPTVLVACNPELKYSLSTFEVFKTESVDSKRSKQIAAMPLPSVRKCSAKVTDKLEDLIATSQITEAGGRSEADFAVCCHALRSGIDKELVWGKVQHVGKFADEGRRYFDLTWENAEYDVRAGKLEQLQKKTTAAGASPFYPMATAVGDVEDGVSQDCVGNDQGRPTIWIDQQNTPVGATLHQVTDRLLESGDCFTRADQLVVVHGEEFRPVLVAQELAGLMSEHVEFFFIDTKGGEYKPLPTAYANTWLNNRVERSRLPAIALFTRNPVYTEDWRLVDEGYDPASKIYYAGPKVNVRASTDHLDALLRDFCFKRPGDRTNYLGILLTALLVPRFIGSKPAALFNGNQPELGKSILAQILAILRDGKSTETVSYKPNDEEFEKSLGALVRGGKTTLIVDNAKTQGQTRIDSACLERSITDHILCFRLLGQSACIRAENSHIFCITANTARVSRDLVTRSVVINLHHDGNPSRRKFTIEDPEGYAERHRLELLGELIGMVERWRAAGMPMANTHSRFNKRGWGNSVGGILEFNGEPDFLSNADETATLLDETRSEFTELVAVMAAHSQGAWNAAELVDLCRKHEILGKDLGEGTPRSLSTKMGTLATRFIEEAFRLSDGCEAVFHRSTDRKGNIYKVSIQKSAEP